MFKKERLIHKSHVLTFYKKDFNSQNLKVFGRPLQNLGSKIVVLK